MPKVLALVNYLWVGDGPEPDEPPGKREIEISVENTVSAQRIHQFKKNYQEATGWELEFVSWFEVKDTEPHPGSTKLLPCKHCGFNQMHQFVKVRLHPDVPGYEWKWQCLTCDTTHPPVLLTQT